MRKCLPPPSLPAIVARVVALCSKDEFSLDELIRILEADPSISSRLLRLSNSAYYGFSREIDSLPRAALVLGRITVQAIALASTLLQPWRGRALPPAVEILWTHAYLCGLGCRHLARRLPPAPWRSTADALFLTGLLHDLGKILFLAESPDSYSEALETSESRETLLRREKEHFGVDHAEAGGAALEAWAFPAPLAAVVRYHHSGGLRAEFRADWDVLRTVNDLLGRCPHQDPRPNVPEVLAGDLETYLEGARSEAKAFYEAIT